MSADDPLRQIDSANYRLYQSGEGGLVTIQHKAESEAREMSPDLVDEILADGYFLAIGERSEIPRADEIDISKD
jgi:hypothetical protein